MNNTLKTSVLMVVLASTSVAAQTNLIDFETLPGGASPTEGMAISNQFWTTHGVSFVYTNGTFPVVAMDRGTRTYAFLNNSNFLTNAVVFASWAFYALNAGSVLLLRRRRPDAPRPFRVPGFPVVPVVFIALAIALLANTFYAAPMISLFGAGVMALGALVFRVAFRGS